MGRPSGRGQLCLSLPVFKGWADPQQSLLRLCQQGQLTIIPTMAGVAPHSRPQKGRVLTTGDELREGVLGRQP